MIHTTSQPSASRGVHCHRLFIHMTSPPPAIDFFGCFVQQNARALRFSMPGEKISRIQNRIYSTASFVTRFVSLFFKESAPTAIYVGRSGTKSSITDSAISFPNTFSFNHSARVAQIVFRRVPQSEARCLYEYSQN